MKKIMLGFFVAILLASAYAQADDMITQGKQLADSNVSCGNLSEGQLEAIGDYYMEQLHPGAQHAAMERMMGGEGSESLRQAHIQMAEVLYCGKADTQVTYAGMMGLAPMMGRLTGTGIANYSGLSSAFRGMMGQGTFTQQGGMMGSWYGGMMNQYSTWSIVGNVFLALLLVGLVVVIYSLIRCTTGKSRSPLEILEKRYAIGEISKKEFLEMRKELQKNG